MNKTITIWNAPVEIVPAIIELMNKKSCSLLLEDKFDEANDIIYYTKRLKEDYLCAINGGSEE